MADRKASIAHLTDAVGLHRKKPNDLMFAESKLAEADLNFMRYTKLFDSHNRTDFHLVNGHASHWTSTELARESVLEPNRLGKIEAK